MHVHLEIWFDQLTAETWKKRLLKSDIRLRHNNRFSKKTP